MTVYQKLPELIGNTPLLRLNNYGQTRGLRAVILGKLEYFNPGGSIKDRVARAMIAEAEARGLLWPGATIIEPTSGNTGIGLALVAASRGYRLILTMPETMSVERRRLLAAYGTQLVLTPGALGMSGAIEKARELVAANPGSFMPGQFDNPANPAAHYASTGPEIWKAANGRVDVLVCGVGTGGTITGAGGYLREMNPKLKIVAVEPAASPVLSGGRPGPHQIQGIGAGFIPAILDVGVYNEIITVTDTDAFAAREALARTEGLLVGVSSGAAVWAASQLAKRPEHAGQNIVAVLPDTGERYLSMV